MKARGRWFWAVVALQAVVVCAMVARKQAVLLYGRPIVLRSNPVDPHSLFSGDYARLAFAANQLQGDEREPWPPKIGGTVYAELEPGPETWQVVAARREVPADLPADHVVMRGVIRYSYQREGHMVTQLRDLSDPGWLATQPSTAPWRRSWGWGGIPRDELWFNAHLEEGRTVYVIVGSYDGGRTWQSADIRQDDQTRLRYGQAVQRVLTGSLGPFRRERLLNVEYGIESYYIPEEKGRDFQRGRFDAQVFVDKAGRAVIKSLRPVS